LSSVKDSKPQRTFWKVTPFTAGVLTVLLALFAAYLAFNKGLPFSEKFELKATFKEASLLRPGSEVRIAGVKVGKVSGVEQEGKNLTNVVLELDKDALPVHSDATLKIRPRIFLEGNFFVDLKPGTPSAPDLKSGSTVPITQTSVSVQLDQVLTDLQIDSREDLSLVLKSYGSALTRRPTVEDERSQDGDVYGKSAAEALNGSLSYSAEALKGTAQVSEALQGQNPNDLSGALYGVSKVSAALVRNRADLQGLVTNLNTTMSAFAAESVSVQRSLQQLPSTLSSANAAFNELNDAFPDTRALVLEITPGIKEIPETVDAALPWITETRGLVSQDELGSLAVDLKALAPNLAKVSKSGKQLFTEVDLLSKCAKDVILPTVNVKLQDGDFSSNVENYKELFYGLVGQAGESQNFDGNGQYIRIQPGGGDVKVESGKIANRSSGSNKLFGNAVLEPLGTKPTYPDKRPEFKTDVACHLNELPNLNGPAAESGPASPSKVGG